MAQRRLHSVYGDYLLFEHGTRHDNAGGCGIYHAHLHAVPFLHINDPLRQLKKAFRYDQIGGLLDLKLLDEKASYLYYKDVAGKQYVFHTEHLPSQYMRRLLAQALVVVETVGQYSHHRTVIPKSLDDIALHSVGCFPLSLMLSQHTLEELLRGDVASAPRRLARRGRSAPSLPSR